MPGKRDVPWKYFNSVKSGKYYPVLKPYRPVWKQAIIFSRQIQDIPLPNPKTGRQRISWYSEEMDWYD